MELLKYLEKYGKVGYVESYQLVDKKETSPSHRVKVFEEQDIIKVSPDFINIKDVEGFVDEVKTKIFDELYSRECNYVWENVKKIIDENKAKWFEDVVKK